MDIEIWEHKNYNRAVDWIGLKSYSFPCSTLGKYIPSYLLQTPTV